MTVMTPRSYGAGRRAETATSIREARLIGAAPPEAAGGCVEHAGRVYRVAAVEGGGTLRYWHVEPVEAGG